MTEAQRAVANRLVLLILLVKRTNLKERRAVMVRLEMTEDEAKILRNVIENYRGHLEVEIHRTERREFREALEKREKFLREFVKRLDNP